MNPDEMMGTLISLQLDVEMKAEQGLRDQAKLLGLGLREYVILLMGRIEQHRDNVSAYSRQDLNAIAVCASTYLTQLCTTLMSEDEDK